ncbi:MAG: peroxiredoxin [Vulcanimicrobiota bacterium]
MSEQVKHETTHKPTFLSLDEVAPDFTAHTTEGRIKLSDYEGKWVVLFSHPADFTPVCTTEFIAFAQSVDEFKELNTELIGLSIDSVHSHIAWKRNIEEHFGIKVPFPIIADLDKKVSLQFGMLHPGSSSTATVRCVFIIDPKRVMRAMLYYPMSNGRFIPEIIRLIKALQTTDKHKVATPANWQPGDEIILPPPPTYKDAAERVKTEKCVDWYFCKKKLQ